MSQIYFCSDPHLGHENIPKFRQFHDLKFDDVIDHDEWVMEELSIMRKRDRLYMVGDVAFNEPSLSRLQTIAGEKYLVRGNHDEGELAGYAAVFKNVYGLLRYKSYWVSHAPIHPRELRGKVNLHGHVHTETVPDRRYLNLCPENLYPLLGRILISLDEIRYLRPKEFGQ